MNELDRNNEIPLEDDLNACTVLLEQYCAVQKSSFYAQLTMIQNKHVATSLNQTYRNCTRDHKSVRKQTVCYGF